MQTAQWHTSTQNTAGNQAEWDSRKARSDLFFSPQNAHFQKTNQPNKIKAKSKKPTKHPNQNKQKISPQNPTETEKKQIKSSKGHIKQFLKKVI